MTDRELALRHSIMQAFAQTGSAPEIEDQQTLRALAERHVVVLDPEAPGRILMAHPFAAHRRGTRVDAGGRTWWGNCAWDGLGIVAALKLSNAVVTSNGVALEVHEGEISNEAVFHVALPAREWWDDIVFT